MPDLFPRDRRDDVRAFGRFVRVADAIADDPFIDAPAKLARLDALESRLEGGTGPTWSAADAEIAELMRQSICRGAPAHHAHRIVDTFRSDVNGHVNRTWADLIAYCQGAAAPVGRHLLDLVDEDAEALGPESDDLCAALRILKRLRDSRDKTLKFNRLCIPEQFLTDALVSLDHLNAPAAKGQTRAVIDRVLDGVDSLLARSATLPRRLRSRSLRIHTGIVHCRARKLADRFRVADPLQGRVHLSRAQRRACAWGTIFTLGLSGR